jgi:hypothetical protein
VAQEEASDEEQEAEQEFLGQYDAGSFHTLSLSNLPSCGDVLISVLCCFPFVFLRGAASNICECQ